MKDKNGKIIKHRDIIKINAEWFSRKESIYAVYGHGLFKNKDMQVYNPNCCIRCRKMEGSICELEGFNSNQIEIIGNLDKTPELLPLREI
jgi:hypothetical protein